MRPFKAEQQCQLELLTLLQYHCHVQRKEIICQPVKRFFERCKGSEVLKEIADPSKTRESYEDWQNQPQSLREDIACFCPTSSYQHMELPKSKGSEVPDEPDREFRDQI
eukprot:TRINITY_DN81560_c0_g1_i1.p1 TRINITY_DN81560_c0_g1~~TRINITY_DN81560_c0_g1_i1.p1  ORF type:complete len:109 (-),score=7.97 TRINITY_DN81560_c0_g1_i1:147-473(-)